MADSKHTPRSGKQDGAKPARNIDGQGDMTRIRKVDLSLHGDAVSHWQDEPQGGDDQKKKAPGGASKEKGRNA